MAEAEKAKTYRTPLFKALRKITDAVEDVVDDVIERGTDVERDARRLVDNVLREREECEGGEKKSAPGRVEK